MRDAQIIRYNTPPREQIPLESEFRTTVHANELEQRPSRSLRVTPLLIHASCICVYVCIYIFTRFPVYGNNNRFLRLTGRAFYPSFPLVLSLAAIGRKTVRALSLFRSLALSYFVSFRLSDTREGPKVSPCMHETRS